MSHNATAAGAGLSNIFGLRRRRPSSRSSHFSLDRAEPDAYKKLTENGPCFRPAGGEMALEGYLEYQRREFCKDVRCPVQMELMTKSEGSQEYERLRQTCREACRYTTWQFHHWLIDKGYLIVRAAERAESQGEE